MHTPSTARTPGARVTRRRLLAAVGTGTTAALAGCSALGRSGPRSLNPADVIEDDPTTRVWEFPRGASDAETPVQTYLDQAARVPAGAAAPVRFRFGASVFSHSEYRHERIELRVRAPAQPRGDRPPADVFVEPLGGGFTAFRTYRDGRETVIVLDELSETGTLEFGFLVAPRTRPTPDALGYAFEVRAANPGLFDADAVASSAGQFPIAVEDG